MNINLKNSFIIILIIINLKLYLINFYNVILKIIIKFHFTIIFSFYYF